MFHYEPMAIFVGSCVPLAVHPSHEGCDRAVSNQTETVEKVSGNAAGVLMEVF